MVAVVFERTVISLSKGELLRVYLQRCSPWLAKLSATLASLAPTGRRVADATYQDESQPLSRSLSIDFTVSFCQDLTKSKPFFESNLNLPLPFKPVSSSVLSKEKKGSSRVLKGR